MGATQSPSKDTLVERVCNAPNLASAQNWASKAGSSFVLQHVSQDEDMITYKFLVDGKVECDELNYCTTCKRSLVDTSYCEGCEQDEEDDFNRGDWM